MLIAMRAAIVWWVTLSLTPIEGVFDASSRSWRGAACRYEAFPPRACRKRVGMGPAASHGEQLP